ncbi:MAG: ATP-binding protein [Dehalococcoidia bacterium]|nr:ATP-binding protein [Dehalococcoidia bacterium]
MAMMKATRLADDVGVLKQSLPPLPEPVAHPALIVVSGLPGTGKSYFCRKLAERIDLVILESDSLRKLLFPAPSYSKEESIQLFRACHGLVEELLRKGISVALDATNLEEHNREQLYHIADQSGAKLIIVRIEAPPELVQQRLEGRARRVDQSDHSEADWDVYSKMKPTVQKINRNHFAVDSSRDIAPVIDKIVRLVNR